jgi:23S rRNA pseudouridine955/2504/2580 synthase
MTEEFYFTKIFSDRENERIDKLLRRRYPLIRLSVLQSFIRSGKVFVDGKRVKDGAFRIQIGQEVLLKVAGNEEEIMRRYGRSAPEHIPLDIELDVIYEDKEIIAFNKPAVLSVQPGTNVSNKSLYNALLGRMEEFFFVHRLDKYTSGVIIVSKTHESAKKLSELFSSHDIEKKYITLVKGLVKDKLDIKTPLDGKNAFTRVEPLEFYSGCTLLSVQIFTGRKHQIRRHLAMNCTPVIGDEIYGDSDANEQFKKAYDLNGYFLHCSEVSFIHPVKHLEVKIKAPLDVERQKIIKKLRKEG